MARRPSRSTSGRSNVEKRELVARALQEQHWNIDLGKMRGALVRRLARRMERESDEYESEHSGEGRCCLRLRGHPSAEGLAAGEQGEPRNEARCRRHRAADRGLGNPGRIGALRAALHVRELIAKRRDTVLREMVGETRHERMRHPRTRAVRHHVAGARVWRRLQETADALVVIDGERHRAGCRGHRFGANSISLRAYSGAVGSCMK